MAGYEARTGPGWVQALGPATTTVLLRHGETALSGDQRFAGRGDIPLTATGREQAAAAAAGLPPTVQDGWAEVDFGEWEGLSHAEAEEGWPEQMAAWLSDPGAAPPGGESLAAASDRVLAALDSLLAGHPGATVLVVSHVTPMKILLQRALLAPPAALRRMFLGVACLCEISWYAGGVGVVRTLNDTAHLSPREFTG